jgi:hypothetical protein
VLSQQLYEAFWERQRPQDPEKAAKYTYTPWEDQAVAIKDMWNNIADDAISLLKLI